MRGIHTEAVARAASRLGGATRMDVRYDITMKKNVHLPGLLAGTNDGNWGAGKTDSARDGSKNARK